MSSAEIAERLGVSDRTVRRHLAAGTTTTGTTVAGSTGTADAEAGVEVAA